MTLPPIPPKNPRFQKACCGAYPGEWIWRCEGFPVVWLEHGAVGAYPVMEITADIAEVIRRDARESWADFLLYADKEELDAVRREQTRGSYIHAIHEWREWAGRFSKNRAIESGKDGG